MGSETTDLWKKSAGMPSQPLFCSGFAVPSCIVAPTAHFCQGSGLTAGLDLLSFESRDLKHMSRETPNRDSLQDFGRAWPRESC